MTGERTGLRLRLFAIVLAAVLAALAPLSIALLLQVRDAIYARRFTDARLRIASAAQAARSGCDGPRCVESIARGAGGQLSQAPCSSPMARSGEDVVLCADAGGGTSIVLHENLAAVREQLSELDARLLLTLAVFAGALVLVTVWLLDRGVVRRLGLIDEALEAVGAKHGGPSLLPEGGDAVGRVGAAVNRLVQRLGEERARTRAQIAELESANRQIREAREEVERSERLATVGRLAAGVAHEVGNPVSALIGYAALMRERLKQGKDVSEYAERVEREAARIDRILRDLLELARPRATPLGKVDLARAAANARAAVEPQEALRGVTIDDALPAGLPPVLADEHHLVQVLVNLVTNAARAGARNVRLAAISAPGAVQLSVEDDGKGIAPEALPRLFEPFFTTAGPGQGTGLGLALCHATMERFGGSISARNRDGARGAVFELRFRSVE